MADPTPEQVMATARAMGGRVSVARNELLRLLEAVLPGTVALHNETEGTRIKVPKAFLPSRVSLAEQKEWPVVVVAASVGVQPKGGGTRWKRITLGVFVIGGPVDTKEEVDDVWDLAELADIVVGGTQQHWCLPEPDGRMVWNQLLPESITQLSGDWEKYSGTMATYYADQRGLDLWTPAP